MPATLVERVSCIIALLLAAGPAWGQTHFPSSQAMAMQTIVNRPNVSLVSGAAAVVIDPADSRRVYASCTVTGTGSISAAFGDSTTGAGSGVVILGSNPPVAFSTNDAIYAFTSSSGVTINCIDYDLK
jgi:hypothetical protein